MKTEDIVGIGILVAIGAVALGYWKGYNIKPTSRHDVEVKSSQLDDKAFSVIVDKGGETTGYKFYEGEWDKLNWSQKFLYKVGIPPKYIFE